MGDGQVFNYAFAWIIALVTINFAIVGIGVAMIMTDTIGTLTLLLLAFASTIDVGVLGFCIHYGMATHQEG